jgi:hypothetical protein
MKTVKTKCQNGNCKNEVRVLEQGIYFGILCKQCSEHTTIFSTNYEG